MVALLALLAPAAAGDDPAQHPPKMPDSTAWAKKGRNASWSDVYHRHDHRVIIGATLRNG